MLPVRGSGYRFIIPIGMHQGRIAILAYIDYYGLSRSTLEELAGQGDTDAMIALGLGLYFGSFWETDVGSAYDWFSEAYRKGEAKAAPASPALIPMRIIAAGHMNSIRKGRRSG